MVLHVVEKKAIPQSPEVVKTLSDFVYNRSVDPEKLLSFTFPQNGSNHTQCDPYITGSKL
jgi:hypothetical protein